jgi:hypothetical protein
MDSKPEDAVSHFGDADNKKDHEVDGSTEMKIDIANTDLVAPLGAAKKPNPRSCSLSQLWIITRRRFGKGRGYLRMDLFLPLVFYVISPGAHWLRMGRPELLRWGSGLLGSPRCTRSR